VERMGGTIGVESTVGLGTTCRFDVLLGVYRDQVPPAIPVPVLARPPDPAPPPFSTVLLAEDNATNRLIVTRMLEREGLQVVAVENGRLAVEAMRRNAFDVVLMDVMMPEMDGYEAMRRIRAMDAYKNLPMIALTAKAMKGDREKCMEAGASDYITKPIDAQQLVSLLRVWLYR